MAKHFNASGCTAAYPPWIRPDGNVFPLDLHFLTMTPGNVSLTTTLKNFLMTVAISAGVVPASKVSLRKLAWAASSKKEI